MRHPIAAALAGLAFTAMAIPAPAQPFKAYPVDEAGEEPELQALRDSLLEAVRRRDTDAVVALAAPDIVLSFGGHYGTETLRQWLDGDSDVPWAGPVYWQWLQDVLELGGMWWGPTRETDPQFCAPYTFYAEYPADIDPFDVIMIIRDDAPLHSGPGPEHPVIATLSYDIAEVFEQYPSPATDDLTDPYWVSIRTADGAHEGYVVSTDLRWPVDYRACFSRDPESGAWIWESFLGGD